MAPAPIPHPQPETVLNANSHLHQYQLEAFSKVKKKEWLEVKGLGLRPLRMYLIWWQEHRTQEAEHMGSHSIFTNNELCDWGQMTIL